jgi:putative transposase
MVDWDSKKRYFAKHLSDEPMSRLCRLLRISRQAGYLWKAKLEKDGLRELLSVGRRGRPTIKTDENTRDAILTLRERYGWNEKTLKYGLEDIGIKTSFYRVRNALGEARMLGKAPLRKPPASKRYCRPWPNHLWHGDWSEYNDGVLFSLQDDYSRYVVAAMEFDEQSTLNALFVVKIATYMHGAPYQLITDRGTEFWNNRMNTPNSFGETLDELGVSHIVARKKHPQTNGKLENWFGVCKHQSWRFTSLDDYRHHYNYEQPNRAIGWKKPYQRYFDWVL